MNSEGLKDFRQAAYDLLLKALICHIRVDGCSDDHKECGLLGPIFASVHYSIVNGKRVYEALQDCRPDRKKLMMLYLQQLEQQAPPTEHILVAIDCPRMGETIR